MINIKTIKVSQIETLQDPVAFSPGTFWDSASPCLGPFGTLVRLTQYFGPSLGPGLKIVCPKLRKEKNRVSHHNMKFEKDIDRVYQLL